MSNWKVPPKTFTQEQLYLAGYRIEYTPICTYEARTSSGKTLAISRDVDDCWQACWEDHQQNQKDWQSEAIARGAILENMVLVAQEHGYQSNSWISSIHYLDEQLKEAKEIIEDLWDNPKDFYLNGFTDRVMKMLGRTNPQGK